jgi:hypothetical protein
MASFHTYVVSSLPALMFGMKPPVSFNKFLSLCKDLIHDDELAVLAGLAASEGVMCAGAQNETLRKWRAFDTVLRNELVEIRASRKKADPAKYLRLDGCPDSSYAAHMAINAYRKPSILEAERALDADRWRELDELSVGHYFDPDTLIIYGLKLLILEKWDKAYAADKERLLESALAGKAAEDKERS